MTELELLKQIVELQKEVLAMLREDAERLKARLRGYENNQYSDPYADPSYFAQINAMRMSDASSYMNQHTYNTGKQV